MGMNPGYKQTEAGVIPDDWRVRRLRDIGVANWGNTAITKASYRDAGYQAFSASGPDGLVSWFEHDDVGVVLSAIGARCGKTWLAHEKWTPIKNTIWFQGDGVCANTRYLYWITADPEFWPNRGQAQPFIALGDVRSVLIPLPPRLQEQEAIAEALFDADALIESLEQLLAKKRRIKEGAMQELLTGKTRLPGFDDADQLVTDELGTRPSKWGAVKLVDLVEPTRSIRYGIVQPGMYAPAGRYMIRGQDYSEAKGWADPSEVFRVSRAIEERYRNARVRSGDLIMTIVGYCGHVEMVPDWLEGANLTQTTARIAIQRSSASPEFCKYMLQGPVGKKQVAARLKGAAQPGLNCGDVETFMIPRPRLEEQIAIADVLSSMDMEAAALEMQLSRARQLKQGMMQELLTGRIRLI